MDEMTTSVAPALTVEFNAFGGMVTRPEIIAQRVRPTFWRSCTNFGVVCGGIYWIRIGMRVLKPGSSWSGCWRAPREDLNPKHDIALFRVV